MRTVTVTVTLALCGCARMRPRLTPPSLPHTTSPPLPPSLTGEQAPEILRYQRYDAKADLWSVGAILVELITGHTPFKVSGTHTQQA